MPTCIQQKSSKNLSGCSEERSRTTIVNQKGQGSSGFYCLDHCGARFCTRIGIPLYRYMLRRLSNHDTSRTARENKSNMHNALVSGYSRIPVSGQRSFALRFKGRDSFGIRFCWQFYLSKMRLLYFEQRT